MAMYTKALTKDFRLRLSEKDFNFLAELAAQRGVTISEVMRSMIDEYRRALDTTAALREALTFARENRDTARLSDEHTKGNINDNLQQ